MGKDHIVLRDENGKVIYSGPASGLAEHAARETLKVADHTKMLPKRPNKESTP
jgi:hypothetical protein